MAELNCSVTLPLVLTPLITTWKELLRFLGVICINYSYFPREACSTPRELAKCLTIWLLEAVTIFPSRGVFFQAHLVGLFVFLLKRLIVF
jgi:hypothetical protein